jgi:hypothetical protein
MSFEPATSTVGKNMANVEIKLKLSVDLDIKAERDDIPHLTDSMKQQIAGAFAPAALIGGSQRNPNSVEQLPPPVEVPLSSSPEKSRRPRRTARGSEKASPVEENVIDWVHDPSKWGNSAQSWSTAERCLWLLYVIKQERGINELSASVIAATLRKHFRQAGLVYANIVARELGKLKPSGGV